MAVGAGAGVAGAGLFAGFVAATLGRAAGFEFTFAGLILAGVVVAAVFAGMEGTRPVLVEIMKTGT